MLSHRTNVLFEEKEWQALAKLAKREGVSVGNLLRRMAKQLVEASEQSDNYQLQDQKKMYVQIKEGGLIPLTHQKQATNREISTAMKIIAAESFKGEGVTIEEIKQWIEAGRERKLQRDDIQRKIVVRDIKAGWKFVKQPHLPINYEKLVEDGRKY